MEYSGNFIHFVNLNQLPTEQINNKSQGLIISIQKENNNIKCFFYLTIFKKLLDCCWHS